MSAIFTLLLSFLLLQPSVDKLVSKQIKTIIIDAGHGGKDPGAIGVSGVKEKDVNLSIALKLKTLLEANYSDINVVMTRSDDRFIELHDRGRIANTNNGDLFISIHANSKKKEDAEKKGFEIYLLDIVKIPEAQSITKIENKNIPIASGNETASIITAALAQNVFLKYSEIAAKILLTEMVKGTRLQSRGAHQEQFIVLYGASMPSLLVECGYLTDESEEKYLASETGQMNIAASLYKGIRLFKMDYDWENR